MQSRILGTAIFAITLGLAGCGSPPSNTYRTTTASTGFSSATHSYQVRAVDADNQPLAGVSVKMALTSESAPARNEECTTDAQGFCAVIPYEVRKDSNFSYLTVYRSRFEAEGSLPGYYPRKEFRTSAYGSSAGASSSQALTSLTLSMLKPTDYLDDSLANSPEDRALKGRVLDFLDVIRVQGFLTEADVMLKGIGVSEFKGRKYLRVKVNSTTVFNSLKLDKYSVGKRLFDDSVRKMLNPLNDVIAAPRAFYGYDLVVYGYSKSFSDKYAKPERLEFRFLMPEASVRSYKNKDISGQALLDASVLLLDDERIELKLQ